MIICAGESLIDFVPADTDGSLYQPKPGGSPMNCAVSAARLGGRVKFAGTVSEDFFGDRILHHLSENAVDTSLIKRVPNATTLAFVSPTTSGDARYAFYADQSADRALSARHLPDTLPAGAIIQMGSISLIADPQSATLLSLAEQCKDEHIVAVDPNIRANLIQNESDYRNRVERALRAAAIVKTSAEDLEWLYPDETPQEAADALFSFGVEMVVITRGPDGSEVRTALHTVKAAGEKVTVSDTIGAGDSFLGAVLVWLDEHALIAREQLRELTPQQMSLMLRFATRVSALTCTRPGADPPDRATVDRSFEE
jgi:fructokinase